MSYDEMVEIVQGPLASVNLPNGKVLIFNNEGKLEKLPANPQATAIWVHHYGKSDFIVGNCIFMTKEDYQQWIEYGK